VLRAWPVDDDGWKGGEAVSLILYYSLLTRMSCDLRAECGYEFTIGDVR
jgi:hypothetical protein